MNLRLVALCALMVALKASASAHRLDEYLQATNVSLAKDRVRIDLRLTPGIAVAARVIEGIDKNHDGVVTDLEQRAYVDKVVGDLAFSMDGHSLRLVPTYIRFPKLDDMRKGLGTIELWLETPIPVISGNRKLIFDNHHQKSIAAYLANCLVPTDPDLHVVAQYRDVLQSHYEIDYVQESPTSSSQLWLGVGLVLFGVPFSFLMIRAKGRNARR